ncbi:MAG: lipid A biosynthesis acyltransferase [Flavipsychrobacter sp.]|nr:lipid A biosynthesis acyltransferase [Flavipsychrobacter sp.]
MAAWEGRSRGTPLGYRIFVWLLQKGGLRMAYALLPFVTAYYRLFVKAATNPLHYLYTQRMGFSKAEAAKLIRKNLNTFGQTLIDKIAVLSGGGKELTFEHEGGHYLNEIADNGKGGIIISAHLGNWEVAGHKLERLGSAINIVMYDGEDQQIRQYMDQFEQKRSFNLILIKEDMSHIYEMSAALARNELICLHADRFRPGNRTLRHTFLGREASFPAGPFILASKLRAPVCFVFAFKQSNFHYHFVAHPWKTYEGRGTAGMERMLDDYVATLERGLQQYPEQWFNYFDFWKDDEDK